ncbi:MAG: uroporphyrinogen-III synthase [Gemmatimonadales bacterium]
MRSLEGSRVVVTRARHQAGQLASALQKRGAIPIVFPTIDIRPVEDVGPVDQAIDDLDQYSWVVFTSGNAVQHFVAHYARRRTQWPAHVRIAAVGRETQRALEIKGLSVDARPDDFRGTALPGAMAAVRGQRVLLPRSAIGRRETVEALVDAGAVVDVVSVYETVPASPDAAAMQEVRQGVDAVTFTSASTVRNFAMLMGEDAAVILREATVAAIGPSTSAALREAGFDVDVQADEYTVEGLVESLSRHIGT